MAETAHANLAEGEARRDLLPLTAGALGAVAAGAAIWPFVASLNPARDTLAAPYGGWFCPCHGSVYDTSARIRQGPAPQNLTVPNYMFATDHTVRIG